MQEAWDLSEWAEACERVYRHQQEAQAAWAAYERRKLQDKLDQWFPVWQDSPRTQAQTFATYHPRTAKQADAKAQVAGWADAFQPRQRRGLYLMGPVGVGKSHLASAVVHQVRPSAAAVYVKVPAMVERMRASLDAPEKGRIEAIQTALRTVPLLVLDDLGTERPTEFGVEQLFLLLDARYELCRPVIVTTNWTLADLQSDDMLGQRMVSRLMDLCDIVVVDGTDYRAEDAVKRGGR